MRFHPGRYIGPCFLFLVLSVIAPGVADWCRSYCSLPPGYGAEEDLRRTIHMPGPVRATVEELSAANEGIWVRECVEDGAWVYELHVSEGGEEFVIRITPNGNVVQPMIQEPEPDGAVEAGG